jgi:hypothetical protein
MPILRMPDMVYAQCEFLPDLVDVDPAEADADVANARHGAEEEEEDGDGVEDVVQREQGLAEHQHQVHRIRQSRVL